MKFFTMLHYYLGDIDPETILNIIDKHLSSPKKQSTKCLVKHLKF